MITRRFQQANSNKMAFKLHSRPVGSNDYHIPVNILSNNTLLRVNLSVLISEITALMLNYFIAPAISFVSFTEIGNLQEKKSSSYKIGSFFN